MGEDGTGAHEDGDVNDEEENFGRLTTLHSENHDGEDDIGEGEGGPEEKQGQGQGQSQRYVITWKVSLGLLQGTVSMPVTLPGGLVAGHGGIDGHNNNDATNNGTTGRNDVNKHGTDGGHGHGMHENGNGNGIGGMHMSDDAAAADEDEESWKMKYLKLQQEYAEERARTRQAIVAALF